MNVEPVKLVVALISVMTSLNAIRSPTSGVCSDVFDADSIARAATNEKANNIACSADRCLLPLIHTVPFTLHKLALKLNQLL